MLPRGCLAATRIDDPAGQVPSFSVTGAAGDDVTSVVQALYRPRLEPFTTIHDAFVAASDSKRAEVTAACTDIAAGIFVNYSAVASQGSAYPSDAASAVALCDSFEAMLEMGCFQNENFLSADYFGNSLGSFWWLLHEFPVELGGGTPALSPSHTLRVCANLTIPTTGTFSGISYTYDNTRLNISSAMANHLEAYHTLRLTTGPSQLAYRPFPSTLPMQRWSSSVSLAALDVESAALVYVENDDILALSRFGVDRLRDAADNENPLCVRFLRRPCHDIVHVVSHRSLVPWVCRTISTGNRTLIL